MVFIAVIGCHKNFENRLVSHFQNELSGQPVLPLEGEGALRYWFELRHPWRLKGSSAGWKSLKNEPLHSSSTAFSFREVDLIQLIFISCTNDMGKNLTECLNFLFCSLEARVFLWRPMLFVLLITLAMEPEDLPRQSILIILCTNKLWYVWY